LAALPGISGAENKPHNHNQLTGVIPMNDNELFSHLEDLVDQHGLQTLIDNLSAIAFEKAQHIASSYGADSQSRGWEKASRKLGRVSVEGL
jgi:hypothetical protein